MEVLFQEPVTVVEVAAPPQMAEWRPFRSKRCRTFLLLSVLTLLGVLIAGYHPGAEDDGVYLAAIQHNLNPRLFRVDADFFALKLQATVFDTWMADLIRITHIPISAMVLLWHLLTIFAILAACHRIASRCFKRESTCWCGVALVSVFFTLPITGTGLYIIDQTLVPRAIATALVLFAVDYVLARKYFAACVLLVLSFLFHPVIAAFGCSLCFFLAVPWPLTGGFQMPVMVGAIVPVGWMFAPVSPALRAAINLHGYCVLSRWLWYEWVGVVAPVFLLLWLARSARRGAPTSKRKTLGHLATRTAVYGIFQLAVALLIMLPPALERMRPLEPMRYLHLLYVMMILLGGCLLGEHVLGEHPWRWAAFFLPAAIGMFLVQLSLFPSSPHLELPGIHSSDPWLQAFTWVRNNTPEDAYFALGPDYLHRPGEDSHGFRALALRSALADNWKDSGMVLTSSQLADRWQTEVTAQNAGHADWQHVSGEDLQRLKAQFGVNWVILERPTSVTLNCPYHNAALEVCRID